MRAALLAIPIKPRSVSPAKSHPKSLIFGEGPARIIVPKAPLERNSVLFATRALADADFVSSGGRNAFWIASKGTPWFSQRAAANGAREIARVVEALPEIAQSAPFFS